MSSPDFSELHGISALPVAKRCAVLMSHRKRQLLWFVQACSLKEGGLKRVARELLAMFPERLVCLNRWQIDHWANYSETLTKEETIRLALGNWQWPEGSRRYQRSPSLEEFMVDFCINPRMRIHIEGEEVETVDIDEDLARESFPALEEREFTDASLMYFRDIVGALIDYKRRYEERTKAQIFLTAIGRTIWKQLDEALKTRTMILLDGLEGRGKTEAVRAWCDCHLGVARFVSLKGVSTKTAQFREFARALGVGHGPSRKVSEMQAGVEEVLSSSKLMPVIDEAHFFFNQGPRTYTRPELLDWIDTALCNPPLPVALVTTPQFLVCMERAAAQVEWNYRQFRRRCKRYVPLPKQNSPEDIEAVARHLLPGIDKASIKAIMGYEALSKRDLSAVGDVVREAKLLAEQEGTTKVTFEHIKRAIHEVLLVSDMPWAEMEKRLQHTKPGSRAGRRLRTVTPEFTQEAAEAPEREQSPRTSSTPLSGSRMRFQEPALEMAEGQA